MTVRPAPADRSLGREPSLPEGSAKRAMVRSMFDAIAPRYDLVNRAMTLGLDIGWRRRAIRLLGLAPGSLVADLACGTGDCSRLLAEQGYRAVGLDFSSGMLAVARTSAPLVQADAGALPFPAGAFDGLVSGFALRNFSDLDAVLAEAARVLVPGGRISLLEVDTPSHPALRVGHRIWFRQVVPRIGAALSSADAYRYLPRSVAYLPPAEELLRRLGAAGFERAARRPLSGGIAQVLTGTRQGALPW